MRELLKDWNVEGNLGPRPTVREPSPQAITCAEGDDDVLDCEAGAR